MTMTGWMWSLLRCQFLQLIFKMLLISTNELRRLKETASKGFEKKPVSSKLLVNHLWVKPQHGFCWEISAFDNLAWHFSLLCPGRQCQLSYWQNNSGIKLKHGFWEYRSANSIIFQFSGSVYMRWFGGIGVRKTELCVLPPCVYSGPK